MQRPPALPLSLVVSGFRTPLHRFGIVSRAAQTLGITYADSFKTAFDDLGATSRALAAARGPAELVAVQAAYLNRAGARATARSAAAGDMILGLTGAFLRPKAALDGAPRPGSAQT
ncbi:phasin family protein [Methylobacterium fujisawaense]|uniref:phasin family protein n=1 Tax=Methylobacterium fujisawaense TaxID=107400 RepID=UPI00313E96F9